MFILRTYWVSSNSGRLRSCSEFLKWRLLQIPVSKQRAVTEFLVHKKNVWCTSINVCVQSIGVMQSIGALLGGGLRELKHQEVQKPSSVIYHVPVILPQPTLQTCWTMDAIIHADRRITTRQLALQLSISTGSVFNYWEMLLQHDNARPHTSLRTRETTSPQWVGQCCPIHPIAHIWHRRTSTSLGLLKMLCMELTLKMTA
jgi:hypothetical protein